MKILFLADYDLLSIGGAQKSSMTYIRQIMNEHECHILSPMGESGICEKLPVVKFHYFKTYKNSTLLFISKLWELVKVVYEISPDYIHAQFAQMGMVLMIYNYFFNTRKVKCIFTDRDFFDAYNKKYHFVFRKFGRKMFRVVCTTEINAGKWKKEVPEDKVRVIPNVLDFSWNCYDRNEECLVRLGEVEPCFVVGFVGRLVSWKRWDVAYEIAKNLNGGNVYFIFVISCFPEEFEKLKEFEDKLKSDLSNIEVLINVNEDDMRKAYYRMDVFVMTSENESFGRTLIEAMSLNTAVIGSDSGGIPEVIGRKENLFPVGDSLKAVSRIRKLMDDQSLCRECKEYGLERVRMRYSLESQKMQILKLYRE